MNSKHHIRERILAERKSFDEYKIFSANELIIENVNLLLNALHRDLIAAEKKTIEFKTYEFQTINPKNSVGLYLPLRGEPDLTKIILYNHWAFALPKIDEQEMKFVHYQIGAKLEESAKGTLQPVSDNYLTPSIIVAPALAYSQKGYRLGFGSGYYDKYFSKRSEHDAVAIIKIGVCFDNYLLEFLPYEKHDIKFDYIVTDKIILTL